jgi:hypothetical protein
MVEIYASFSSSSRRDSHLISPSRAVQFLGLIIQASRLAVYDKKMLWRANLYIDEGDGNSDWNNRHPWVTGNEWNYQFDGQNFTLGNGGQVVKFRNNNVYTPIRPQGEAGKSTNIANSVSYEYPDGVGGTSNNLFPVIFDSHGYDSPFDFIYKMNQMRLKLSAKYTKLISSSNSQGGATVALDKGGAISISQLAQWGTFSAPNNWWQNYPRDLDINYLPDIGLLNASSKYLEPGIDTNFVNTKIIPNVNSLWGAGTDCLGFVSRAAGYLVSGTQKPYYTWPNLPSMDTAETYGTKGSVPSNQGGLNQGTRNVSYPDPTQGLPGVLLNSKLTSWSVFFNTIGGQTSQKNNSADKDTITLFQSLIPGDVVFYDHAHIGTILYVDKIEKAMSYQDLANAVHIIESTFMGPVNYVVTDKSVNSGISFSQEFVVGPYSHLPTAETLYIVRLQ